jgi:hypothetical protein
LTQVARPPVGSGDFNASDHESRPHHRATSAEFFNSLRPLITPLEEREGMLLPTMAA